MGRGRPTYDLAEIQRLLAQGPFTRRVTHAASQGGRELNLSISQVLAIVLDLGPHHFYKTMPAERLTGAWQDVYRYPHARAELYVKLQLHAGIAVVVQFKRR